MAKESERITDKELSGNKTLERYILTKGKDQMGMSVGSERQSLTNRSRDKGWRRGEGEGKG